MPDELWNEVCDIVQETGIKTIPMEKKFKKEKLKSREKRKDTHMKAEFQRIAKSNKKPFLSDECKAGSEETTG